MNNYIGKKKQQKTTTTKNKTKNARTKEQE